MLRGFSSCRIRPRKHFCRSFSKMKRINTVKEKWAAGQTTYGGWLSIPSSFSAELMARQGFDWICVDLQHGLIDYQVALSMITAINTTPCIPFVRVPWNEPGIIGKMLDAGALGVIIPMVNSVEEAKQAVQYCRYYPEGSRSYGPIRAGLVYGLDYYKQANKDVACIPMIETGRAVESIDQILSVPGIDAVYVGPADLSITLGLYPRMDQPDKIFEEALAKVVKSCQKHNVVPGIHGNAQTAEKHHKNGFKMIALIIDAVGLARAAQEDLNIVRAFSSTTSSSGDSKPVYG